MSAKTEDEARQTWCPLVRHVDNADDTVSSNRWGTTNNPAICRCIASQCMAWRHYGAPWPDGSRSGYCGAFGKPE